LILTPFNLDQMEGIKTHGLLTQLDHWSQKRFRKYVASPYVNTDERLLRLLDLLLGSEQAPSRQQLHAVACPELSFDYDRINNFLSYLNQMLEDFLAQEHLREHPAAWDLARLRQSRALGMEDIFRKELRKQQRAWQRIEIATEGEFLQRYQCEVEVDQHRLARRQAETTHLLNSMQALDQFYAVAMLKQACQWRNRQNVITAATTDAEQIERYVQQARERGAQHLDQPLIKAYYLILLTLEQSEEPDHYQQLKQILTTLGSLPVDERKVLSQYAQNYCIKQVNRGETAYLSELFDLYQMMLDQGLIYYQGHIQAADVKNIVALGVRLQRFAWTDAFLTRYESRIEPEIRETVLAYNRAYLLHGQGELRAALRLLRDVAFDDVYYGLGARTLMLKIYYELGDHEGLDAQLQAFEQALRRNRLISAYQRRGHLNLIHFVRKLDQFRIRAMTYSPKQRQQQLAKLRERIEARREIINIQWLRGQLETMGKE